MIAEQLKTLPVPLQRAIAVTPWRKLVADVAAKNSLDAERSEKLEMEVMLVMYGFEPEGDLAANIARELDLAPNVAKALEDDIDMRVFSVVLSTANDFAKEGGEETLQASSAPTPIEPPHDPKVFAEQPKSADAKPSINLVQPKAEEKPLDLTPAKTMDMISEKLSQVTASVSKPSSYPDGRDPYREPVL